MAACTRPARRPSRLRVEPLEDRLVPATLLEVDLFAAVARPAPAFGDLLTTFANPAPTPYDWFGQAVAAGGGRAVVGAPLADPGGVENAGAVYVVDLATGKLAATLTSPAPDRGDQFG
ncbi:MAG: FG-GAP repeat protein, partial [Gemmataceae bacterium]|nr:FG-GAP repeat protein [Gemmataceae bacterium]